MLHDDGCKANGSFQQCSNEWLCVSYVSGLLITAHGSVVFHHNWGHFESSHFRPRKNESWFICVHHPKARTTTGSLPWGKRGLSRPADVQARVHASWMLHRSLLATWETQVSDSTPTHTASKDRRPLLFRITADRSKGRVNALGF